MIREEIAITDRREYQAIWKMAPTKRPFRARMLLSLENRIGRKEKLIARSRERFGTARAVIEDKLNRWIKSNEHSAEK